MNMRRLFSCVFAVCLSLSVLFLDLHTALASTYNLSPSDVDKGTLTVDFNRNLHSNSSLKDYISATTYVDNLEAYTSLATNYSYFYSSFQVQDILYFTKTGYAKMFSEGSSLDFSVSNILNYIEDTTSYDVSFLNHSNVTFEFYFRNEDGSYPRVYPTHALLKANPIYAFGHYDLNFSFDSLPFDVYGMQIRLCYTMGDFSNNTYLAKSRPIKWYGGYDDTVITFEEKEVDKTEGLLGSIIQIVTNIKDGILNLPSTIASAIKGFFDNVVSAVTNVVSAIGNMVTALKDKLSEVITGIVSKLQVVLDGITNALVTLGNFIIDGIMSLFVPTEEDITEMKERWEELLATRFGALYEVVQLCIDYANSFNSAASVSVASGGSSSITFPVVSIPLGSVDFDFGGWEVDVVPSGFEVIVDALKLMVSVCATVLFANGLRNKFERLVAK